MSARNQIDRLFEKDTPAKEVHKVEEVQPDVEEITSYLADSMNALQAAMLQAAEALRLAESILKKSLSETDGPVAPETTEEPEEEPEAMTETRPVRQMGVETNIMNPVSGKLRQITDSEMLSLFDESVRGQLHPVLKRPDVAGIVVYQNIESTSPTAGEVGGAIYGPGCTYKTVEEAALGHLGDAPSRYQYPVAFYAKNS